MSPTESTADSLDSCWAEATAELGSSNRRAMIAFRSADSVIKKFYANNIGKLAAWLSAAHVERPPEQNKGTGGNNPLPTSSKHSTSGKRN